MQIHIKKLGIDGIGQKIVKSQNVYFFTLNSQTLTGLIFKCDLNFGKLTWIHAWEVRVSKDRKNGKKSKY